MYSNGTLPRPLSRRLTLGVFMPLDLDLALKSWVTVSYYKTVR